MSDTVSETLIAGPKRILSGGRLDSCLVHIYPPGSSMGRRYSLGCMPITLGRGESTEIRLDDSSVSRRHARIDPTLEGYEVVDLQSTNGTFVNDIPVNCPRTMRDGDYLRVGNCIYRYLAGGNIESEYHEEIYRLTIYDGLTQVHNKRYLIDFLERELARSVRHSRPLTLIMFDLDRFKSVNDLHGHLCGDYVLRELSDRIRHNVRREDLFARYGGEEFTMVLVETDAPQALEVAEKIRFTIEQAPFLFDSQALKLTVSLGVATTAGEANLSPHELLKLADEKLYIAKRTGRNKVVF